MSKKDKPNKIDAIRMVLDAGTAGDYCDVAEQVKKQFGLTVGEGLIEKTCLARASSNATTDSRNEVEPQKDLAPESTRVLQFVNEMGGFAEAKQAIVNLEKTLNRLI